MEICYSVLHSVGMGRVCMTRNGVRIDDIFLSFGVPGYL